MTTPAVLPDAFHVKQSHAHDVATETRKMVLDGGRDYALFLLPTGAIRRCPIGSNYCAGYMRRYALSLVGVYTEDSAVADIAADLLAMERTH